MRSFLAIDISDFGNYFHCLPKLQSYDTSFDFTMKAVKAAHIGLCKKLKDKSIFQISEEYQDKSLEIRYSKNDEFNDKIAYEFLERNEDFLRNDFSYPLLKDAFFN